MEVWCGMIMGFDSDDEGIFDRQVAFIQQSRIPFAMTGLLHAIPKTPLYERVLAEGRLDLSDRPEFVTNIRPLKMSPEELRDGYLRVMNELFDPENYFDRTEALFLRPDFEIGYVKARPAYWRRRQLRYAWTQAKLVLPAIGLFLRLICRVEPASLRREYRQAALAVPQSPSPSWTDALLSVPHRDALSCQYYGADDGHRRGTAGELFLRSEPREEAEGFGSAPERLGRDGTDS